MRLALVLLITLTALYTVGQLAPDPNFYAGDSPGAKQFRPGGEDSSFAVANPMRRIYDSPVGLALAGLLLLNLSVCTSHRALLLARKKAVKRGPDSFAYLAQQPDGSAHLPEKAYRRRGGKVTNPALLKISENYFTKEVALGFSETIARLEEILASKRYSSDVKANGNIASVYAEKGRIAGWGSVLFHASLLIIIAGAAYGELTSFKGIAVVAEGQTFTEKHDEYVMAKEAPFFSEDKHQGFTLKLNKFTPVYQGWFPTDARSDVSIIEDNKVVRDATIRINNPLKYKGVSFLLDRDGFTPLFAIKNGDGKVIMANWVNLKIGRSSQEEDSFILPGFDYKVAVRIYPDFVMDGDTMTSKSFLPNNPVLYLRIYSPDGDSLAEGSLSLNQSVRLGNFYLAFQDLRYWNSFRVVRNDGEIILFGGFLLAILGLAMRFLLIQKRVWAYVEANGKNSRLYLRGKVNHFDELFADEFQEIANGLERTVVPVSPGLVEVD